MIHTGILDIIILFLGIVLIWSWLPDDWKEELGSIGGFFVEFVWIVFWIVFFLVLHYHVSINIVKI